MKKENLVELAEKKKLPLHQFIDAETVRWIERNRPEFGKTEKLKLPNRETIEHFIPINSWFLKAKEIDSIHGLRHVLRVAVNAFLITREFSYGGKMANLIIAAVLHDIRRKNDKDDPKHGLRAADWFRKNSTLVEKKIKLKFNPRDLEEIYWSILFHELPRSDFKKNKNYYKFRKSVDVIRIADALDRYRLPKIKWWFNEEILGLTISASFKKNAFNLVIKSERSFLKNKNSQESILNLLN